VSLVVDLHPGIREAAPDLVDALEPVYIADNDREREAVFKFRYSVYAEELGRKLGNADHDRRRLHDAEDDKPYTTLLYTSGEDGSLTGTLRLRRWGPGEVPEKDWDAFSMERFAGLGELITAEAGRLMITADNRGKLGLVSLGCALYQLCAGDLGVDVGFINCATGLVRHYRLLGFRTYDGRLVPTPDGIEVPLVMFPSDRAYLEQVGSFIAPFVDVFYGDGRTQPLEIGRYADLLDADSAPVQVDPKAVFERVDRLRAAVSTQPRMLQALSDDTVRRLTDKGFLMKVPTGELLTEQGLAQQELFVILDGVFEVHDGNRRLRIIGPGEVIGEVAFFGSSGRRSASVSAASDGQVLVLRRHLLEELRQTEPAVAAEVLFELARALADRMYAAAAG
jgi:hypothetical protein